MEQTLSETVSEALENAGASLFAKILRLSKRLRDLIDQDQVKLIFALSDLGVANLLKTVNKNGAELLASPDGRDILENHFALAFSLSLPTTPTINGRLISLDRTSLARLQPAGSLKAGKLPIVIINNPIIEPDQLAKAQVIRDSGIIGRLGKQPYAYMIQAGGIKGRDLIALCLSNTAADAYCDERDNKGETIFHRLLRSEFGADVPASENARQLYIDYHSGHEFYIRANHIELEARSYQNLKPITNKNELLKIPGGPYLQVLKSSDNYSRIAYFGLTVTHEVNEITMPPNYQAAKTRKIIFPKLVKIRKIFKDAVKGVFCLGFDGQIYEANNANHHILYEGYRALDVSVSSKQSLASYYLVMDVNGNMYINYSANGESKMLYPLPDTIDPVHDVELLRNNEGILATDPITQISRVTNMSGDLIFSSTEFPSPTMKCLVSKIRLFGALVYIPGGQPVFIKASLIDNEKKLWLLIRPMTAEPSQTQSWFRLPDLDIIDIEQAPVNNNWFNVLTTTGITKIVQYVGDGRIEVSVSQPQQLPLGGQGLPAETALPGRVTLNDRIFEFVD